MDVLVDMAPASDLAEAGKTTEEFLSYDETKPYEEQLPTEAEQNALANRIGASRVYLLSESAKPGKRKHDEDDAIEEEEDDVMGEDPSIRANAIYLKGSPIAHLPTARIFAYAKHFDADPFGLEWVDDTTCVLVFKSIRLARAAFNLLLKSSTEEADIEELFPAKSFPVALWPPEERISSTLGASEGLKGPLRMRWARPDDVKKKGAKKESQFYKKHGETAGKEVYEGRDLPPPKRRRGEDGGRGDVLTEEEQRALLDKELDDFLAEEDQEEAPVVPPSPPSKMRSDYIAVDGRTKVREDRRSNLASRATAPLPRRARGGRGRGRHGEDADAHGESLLDRMEPRLASRLEWGPSSDRQHNDNGRSRRRGGRSTRTERPQKTQQELDDELDAFLRSG